MLQHQPSGIHLSTSNQGDPKGDESNVGRGLIMHFLSQISSESVAVILQDDKLSWKYGNKKCHGQRRFRPCDANYKKIMLQN